MIGTFTNRMAGVLWVILVLSILAVANRIYYTYLALNKLPMPTREGAGRHLQPRVLLDRRARDAALRPLGDRDSRVRLADAAGLAGDPMAQRTAGLLGSRWTTLVVANSDVYATSTFLSVRLLPARILTPSRGLGFAST